MATTTEAKQVLLPRRGALPLLHQAMEWHDLGVAQQPEACQEPAAWLKRAKDRKLAMPVCADLLQGQCSGAAQQGSTALPAAAEGAD